MAPIHLHSGSNIFISAGDVSGDIHAGGLIREISRLAPELEYFGLGGATMDAAGCRLLVGPENEAVMGLGRVLLKIPHFFHRLAQTADFLKRSRPEVVILVDYPGFNFQVARIAKGLGIPVVYFICPQLWAWAPWRIKKFTRLVDLALVIFPFEERFYRSHGVNARYIGHPACDRKEADPIEGASDCTFPDGKILGILPGSRRQEVLLNLPVMLKAVPAVCEKHPSLVPVLSHYDRPLLDLAGRIARDLGIQLNTVQGGMRKLAEKARFCMVGSGTATLEVAFSKTPMVVLYRTTRFACHLARIFLTVPYICQVNLMAGEELVPELLVYRDDPAPLLDRALPLLEEGAQRERMRTGLQAFHERFFHPGALKRAAEFIVH